MLGGNKILLERNLIVVVVKFEIRLDVAWLNAGQKLKEDKPKIIRFLIILIVQDLILKIK